VFQLPAGKGMDEPSPEFSPEVRGQTAFSDDASYDEMSRRYYIGWHFDETVVRSSKAGARACPEDAEPVLVLRRNGDVILFTTEQYPYLRPGDRLLCYIPPPEQDAPEGETSAESASAE
jgi:hypothetical protein